MLVFLKAFMVRSRFKVEHMKKFSRVALGTPRQSVLDVVMCNLAEIQ